MSNFSIEIPKEEFVNFTDLISDENDSLEKINKYLPSVSKKDTLESIENKIKTITKNYKVIFGLIYTFCKLDIPAKKYIKYLYDYYKENSENVLFDYNKFENKLSNIIYDTIPVKLNLKSLILIRENQRIFYDSRILTDIRPIFLNKEREELIGQAIMNQLKIIYHENNETKEFFITLDENDLGNLKHTIERAEKKIKLLINKDITKL